jgi:hypothetical protein
MTVRIRVSMKTSWVDATTEFRERSPSRGMRNSVSVPQSMAATATRTTENRSITLLTFNPLACFRRLDYGTSTSLLAASPDSINVCARTASSRLSTVIRGSFNRPASTSRASRPSASASPCT